jgi:uncharacterized protein
MSLSPSDVWLLPGWQNSNELHWQSCWQNQHGCHRVEQSDWLWPKRGDWITRLEDALDQRTPDDPLVVIAAHSLGCHLLAAWAAQSRYTHRVKGAFLVAPPDLERPNAPVQLLNWRPVATQPLPFKSLLLCSANDPYCTLERSAQLALNWGADWLNMGLLGHINSESGLFDWPQGWRMLHTFAEN